MNNKFEFIMERLRNLYNEVSLSDNEYIEKKSNEFNIEVDKGTIYAIKVGEMKGTIKTLIEILEN